MSQSTRNSRIILAIIALVILLLAGYGIVSRQTSQSGALRRVTIAQVGDFFLYAPLYIAVDAGLFRKEGLDVSIVNTGGDDKTWAAVLSGSAKFGVSDPTFVAISAARGQGGIVVASLVNGVPFWGISYRDLAPIGKAEQLRPFSVATFPAPSTAYALQSKMFSDAGLPPNIRQAGFGAIIPLLKARGADIGLELEPNVSTALADGAKIVYSFAERYGDFAITGVTASSQTVQQDPALVTSVCTALQGALDLLHAEPDRALSLIVKRFPEIPPAVAKAALERVLRDGVIPRTTTVSETAWTKAIELRINVGDLKAAAPYRQFVWGGMPVKK